MQRNWSPNRNPTLAIWALVGVVAISAGTISTRLARLSEQALHCDFDQLPRSSAGKSDPQPLEFRQSACGPRYGHPSTSQGRDPGLADEPPTRVDRSRDFPVSSLPASLPVHEGGK